MIRRRDMIAGTLLAGAGFSAPASACRAPVAKDRLAYTRTIDALLASWWARDFAAFERPFQHPDRTDPFDARSLFDAHFTVRARRFRGGLLFNGASAAVQVIEPEKADIPHGICGGFAASYLFLVKFFPGIPTPVVDQVQYLDQDLLAETEWTPIARVRPL